MRKRFKIPLFVLILLIVVPVLLVVIVTQTGILRSLFVSRLNVLIPPELPLEVIIERISGPYHDGVALYGLAVVRRDPSADTVLFVERVSLSYRAVDLWRGRWVFRRANLRNIRFELPPDSILTAWARVLKPEDKAKKTSGIEFAIDTLTIVESYLRAAGDDRLRVDSLDLTGMLRRAAGKFALTITESEFNLPGLGLSPVRMDGAARTTEAGWSIDSLSVSTPLSEIQVSGIVGDAFQLDVLTDPVSLEELSRVLNTSLSGHARYDGSISLDSTGAVGGRGRLSGEIEQRKIQHLEVTFRYAERRVNLRWLNGQALGARFSGDGYFDLSTDPVSYGYTGQVRGFDLNNVAFETLNSNLSGEMALQGQGLLKKDMRLAFDLNLEGGKFDEYTFDSAAGRVEVTTEAAVFDKDFTIYYKNTDFQLSGFVEYDDSVDIFANVYFRDLRDFEGQTFVDSLAGRGYAFCNLVGKTESPDLIGQFESDSLRIFDLSTNRFSGRYSIPHVFDQRGGRADLAWGESVAWSLPVDSLRTRLRFAGTEVTIDSACIFFPDVFICSNGWLDWGKDTIPVRLNDFAGSFEDRSFDALDTIRFVVDSGGFLFAPFTIDGAFGQVQAEGRVGFDTRTSARLGIDQFQLDPDWRRIFPDIPLTGTVGLQAELKGDFVSPIITGSGAARDLYYAGEYIGDLSGTFSYADRRLDVDSFTLSHPSWSLTGGGVFPVDLAFAEVNRRILEEPQDFRVTGEGQALDPIVWFLPDVVEYVRGPWDLSVRLFGTPAHPQFGGWARLTGGEIKTVELVNPIKNLDVGLEFHHDTVRIVGAVGSINERPDKGNITARGTIKVESLDTYVYDLQLIGKEIPARFEFEDYEVTADVDLAVTGSSPPRVTGSIRVLKGEDREPFSYEEEFELPDTTAWDWNLSVVCPGNYWIRNDQVNAELAFDLHLLRERGIVSILGSAEIVPGRSKVYIFDRAGRIERGQLDFDEPGSSDPRLDMEITFRIPRAAPTAANGEPERIEFARDVDLNLLMSGRASEPLIGAVEGSPYSDQDILLLLAANRPAAIDTLASESEIYLDRIKFAATGLLFSQLERTMARAIGLETISLRAGSSTAETELTVGTYFLRNFYVYGSSAVSFDQGQEVGFEYRFKRGLYLDGRRDRENLYRLNLHLNWEY